LAAANAEAAVARRPGPRSIRVAASVIALGAVAVATVLFTATTAQAQAGPAPAPSPVGENVNSCDDVPPAGDEELFGANGGAGTTTDPDGAGSGTVSGDGITLDVTINAGWTATAIVVKGGPGANVYSGPFVGPITITGMVAPLTPGGPQGQISHWIVCGTKTSDSSPTTEPPGTTTEPPPSSSTDPGGSLSNTGSSLTGVIVGGVALIVVGSGLLLFLRRRRDVGAPPAA
jgi:LPXTG-motif cell wall-anchored protein